MQAVFPLGQIHHTAAESQTKNHLGNRFDNLRNRGRVHILHPLIIAAVGGHQAAGQHRGRKTDDGQLGSRVWNHRRKAPRSQNHHCHAQKTGD